MVTAAVVVLSGGALFLMSDDPPRSVPTTPAVVGTALAPADSAPALAPQSASAGVVAPSVLTTSIPAGTVLSIEISEPVSSADAIVGKEIVATLAAPVMVDGVVAVEAGTKVVGRVTETLELGSTSGSGIFGVAFDRIEIDGKSTPIVAKLRGQQLELAPGRRLELELSQAVDFPAVPVATEPAG